MAINEIIFDVDETLCHHPAKQRPAETRLGIKLVAEVRKCSPENAEKLIEQAVERTTSTMAALAELGVAGGAVSGVCRVIEQAKLQDLLTLPNDPNLNQMLWGLKEEGYGLSTLRNGSLSGTRLTLARVLGLEIPEDNFFGDYEMRFLGSSLGPLDNLFPTAELGAMKPREKPFRNILEKLGVSADSCLMVGDRIRVDLDPARKLGMSTLLVNNGIPQESDHPQIGRIYELPEYLARLNTRISYL